MDKKLFKLLSTLILTFSVLLTSCNSNSSQGSNSGNSSNNGGGGSSNTSHEHTFNDKWEYNDTYHWHSSTCGHDVKANEERHNFTSTVTDPTYEEGGYTTHTCSTCGYSYVDNETDKLEHNYSSSWSYDENSHWHACTDIGYEHLKKDESSHNFTSSVTKPTYEEGGYTTYTCSTCGYSYVDDETEKLEHNYSSSWSYDEYSHWHACIDKGYEHLKKDESNHTFTTSITDPTYEQGGYTTYKCSTCGYSYVDNETDKLEHNYSSSWSYDENSHWHACTDIGYEHLKKDESSHNFTSTVTDPTYESGGYTIYTCTICGYTCTGNDTEPLPITITWKNYDGTILEVDNNVTYGSMPSYDGTAPTKESDDSYNYYFSGWTPEVEKATENTTYTATFASEEITYTIDFDLNGGLSDSYKGPLEVKSFSKDFFFFDCVKENWSFRGWEYQNEKIFDENGNQLKNITIVDNMIFKAIYSQTVKLSILSNNPEAGTITGDGEYQYNTYVDVSVRPNQGYVFIGWYYQGTLLSNTEDYKYMMWDQDITLEARFQLDSFTMHIYSNSENHGLVLLRSNINNNYLTEYSEKRKYTSEVTIAAYSKTDVRFLGWYDENNELVTTNAVYTFVMPNYDYTLEAKWNYFKINYNLNGGINNEDNPTHFSNGDFINLLPATKQGYDFIGWQYDNEIISKIDSTYLSDVILDAIWEDHIYSINYELNGGTNNLENPIGYTINDKDIILKSPTKEGYIFDGRYSDSEYSNKVSYIDVSSLEDIYLYAKWINEFDFYNAVKPTLIENYFTYGVYPQSVVNDDELIKKLNEIETFTTNNIEWCLYENKYYVHSLAKINGEREFNNGQKINNGQDYWFVCEPIEWTIISKEKNIYSLWSTKVLDVQIFNSEGTGSISYEYSDIRTFLNNRFYLAFIDNSFVNTTSIDCKTTNRTDLVSGSIINDKVFLPSYKDAINYSTNLRKALPTDYALAKGVDISSNGMASYWLRSTSNFNHNGSFYAEVINGNGGFEYSYWYGDTNYGCPIISTDIGVRPTITININ